MRYQYKQCFEPNLNISFLFNYFDTRTRAHTHTPTHTDTHIYMHSCRHTVRHADRHAGRRTWTHTHHPPSHTHKRADTQTRRHTHTQTHTHTDTHFEILVQCSLRERWKKVNLGNFLKRGNFANFATLQLYKDKTI